MLVHFKPKPKTKFSNLRPTGHITSYTAATVVNEGPSSYEESNQARMNEGLSGPNVLHFFYL